MARPIITLTTDFGESDYYVGALKGVILGVNPEVEIVDLCHNVIPYDILDAAFTIAQTYNYFPTRTIHVVVVDPGVGTTRRPLLVTGDRHYFVAPDNGVLSFVYAQQENLRVFQISSEHYYYQSPSNTFHARDVFAPVAAWLSKGLQPERFGEPIADYVKLSVPKPQALKGNSWKGLVLKIDRFGNVITNFSPADCPALFADPTPAFSIAAGGTNVDKFSRVYAEGRPNEVFAILGSSGYLELATNRGGAAQLLGVDRGTEVLLELS